MGYKILLADDSITIQKVVELVLTPEGFHISAFSNGEQALAEISTIKPNLILADIEMPKINGYELCKKVKENPSTASIPVILLVGAFEPFDENEAKSVGCDDFIIKPFESQELISKVKALVKEFPEDSDNADIESIQEETPIEVSETLEDKETEITFSEEDYAMLQDQFVEEQQSQETPQEEKEVESFKEVFDDALHTQEVPDASVALPAISKEELLEIYRNVVIEHVNKIFDDTFKEMVLQVARERIGEIVSNITPTIIENTTKEMLNEVAIQVRDKTISILNHYVPETAQEMIQREIAKITADI